MHPCGMLTSIQEQAWVLIWDSSWERLVICVFFLLFRFFRSYLLPLCMKWIAFWATSRTAKRTTGPNVLRSRAERPPLDSNCTSSLTFACSSYCLSIYRIGNWSVESANKIKCTGENHLKKDHNGMQRGVRGGGYALLEIIFTRRKRKAHVRSLGRLYEFRLLFLIFIFLMNLHRNDNTRTIKTSLPWLVKWCFSFTHASFILNQTPNPFFQYEWINKTRKW